MAARLLVSPRKQPHQARARATVEAILAATAQVLMREGSERITTNRVAELAGVSIGSVYQYFPNKASLVSTLIERHHERMLAQLTSATREMQAAGLVDAVRAYVRALLEAHALEPELHRALIQEMPRLIGADRLRMFSAECELAVQGYLEYHRQKLRVQNLSLTAFLLVTTVEAVAHAAVLDRPKVLRDEEFVAALGDLVLRYLLA